LIDDNNIIEIMVLNKDSDINGIHLGMNISEIQGMFGEGELNHDITDENFPYVLTYKFEDFSLWIAADKNDETIYYEIRFWVW